MADLLVPSVYPTIRAAISASTTNDTIKISGTTSDITAGGAPPTFAYAALPNIFSITGFTTVTSLNYDGDGNFGDPSSTTITGNPRLFVSNQDGRAPVALSFTDLDFLYTNPYSNYILQTGNFGVPVSSTITKTINLDNVSFRGVHPGNWLSSSGNPLFGAFGNYAAVIGIQSLTLNNSLVSLAGQGTFTATQADSGGSSFLLTQGTNILVTNNSFNESGYRNALSIYESANVIVSGNSFFRDPGSRFVRTDGSGIPKSNKIKDSTSVITSNTFSNGSFLSLEGGSGTVTGNTFNGTNTQDASSGAIGVYLEGPPVPAYSYTSNTFTYVSPFVNATNAIQTVTTNGAGDNLFTNPRTTLNVAIQQFVTGTSSGELLTGQGGGTVAAPRRDFLSGGLGNDTLDGGTGGGVENSDFFLFNTTPNAANNLDTIINWTASSAPPSTYRDQLVLDRKIYTNLTVVNAGGSVYTLNGIGGIQADLGGPNGTPGQNQVIANTTATFSNPWERIALDTSGANMGTLYYDQDGNGSSFAPIPFVRIATGNNPATGPWISSLAQLGQILVM